MHELSITENIIKIVEEEAKKFNNKKIKKINIIIGKLTTIVPDCVRFYFDILSKNTICEGAILEIKEKAIKIKCLNCGKLFTIEEINFFCPDCHSYNTEIIEGQELLINSIEIENGDKIS